MRDEQVRRYARHILLPDVGGLGQTALMVSSARLELRESEPDAELIAATYLAAGGVGTVVIRGASPSQVAGLVAHGPDTKLATDGDGEPVLMQPRPPWWPSTEGDTTALAFWRGGVAATRWMSGVANR
ncbi:MAG TPA: hypothetical protein VIU61_04100 [Kofleriaceae bacterium]